jgi:hypothetical protein
MVLLQLHELFRRVSLHVCWCYMCMCASVVLSAAYMSGCSSPLTLDASILHVASFHVLTGTQNEGSKQLQLPGHLDMQAAANQEQMQQAQQQQQVVQQHQQHAPAGRQSIPRIIHQNYLAGAQQLLVDAMQPLSHFRKEWWLSCKVNEAISIIG